MCARTAQELHTLFAERFNAADVDGLLQLYDEHSCLITRDGPARGLKAIRQAIAGFLASKPKMQLQTRKLIEHDGFALLSADWKMTGQGSDGKSIEVAAWSSEVGRRNPDGTWTYLIDDPFGGE
jgi:ketosteroid isomerase-like protein